MGKSDKYMADRVRSAKVWLEKAERSFARQSDIQGELNLMLAEAEMKNLRKKKRRTLGKRIVATTVAIMGILVGVSAFFAIQQKQEPVLPAQVRTVRLPQPQPVLQEEVPAGKSSVSKAPLSVQDVPVTMPEAQTVPEPAPAPPPPVVPDSPRAPRKMTSKPSAAPAAEPVLSDQQVQAAVQDARHTLRSTATERK